MSLMPGAIPETLSSSPKAASAAAAAAVTPLAHPLKLSVQRTSPIKESGNNVCPPSDCCLPKSKSNAAIVCTPPLPKRGPVTRGYETPSPARPPPPAPPPQQAHGGVYLYRATEKDVNDVKLCILAYYRLKRLRGQTPTRATMDYINSLGCCCRGGCYSNNTPLSRVPSGGSSIARSHSGMSPMPGSPPGSGKPPRSPPRRKADDIVHLSSRLAMVSNGGPSA